MLAFGVGLFALLPHDAKSEDTAIPVVDLAEELTPRSLNGPQPFDGERGQATDLRLRQGNVVGVVLPLHEPRPWAPLDMTTDTVFHDVERWLSQSGEFRSPGCSRPSDGIRTWFAIDGASELAREPTKIGLWVTRGVRLFRLVDSEDNELATSWKDPPPGPVVGLSSRGAEVVRRIYAAGGIVDIGSGSAMTRQDVLEIARELKAPVVSISSNAWREAGDARNLTDSELRAVGASGGVVAVSFDEHRIVRGHAASLHDLLRQILYMARVAGIDHVAIGSGYEGVRAPDGLETAARFPVLARALVASGMSHDDVERIFNRNALRVLCPHDASK